MHITTYVRYTLSIILQVESCVMTARHTNPILLRPSLLETGANPKVHPSNPTTSG